MSSRSTSPDGNVVKRPKNEQMTKEEKFLREKGLTEFPHLLTYDKFDADMKRRTEKILQGDVVYGTPEKPEDVPPITLQNEFNKFCEKFPHWAEAEQSFVVWRDHPKMKDIKDKKAIQVVRVQNSGLCYMHAPAVLQHYVITKNSGGTHHEMLNIAKYIKYHFTTDQLYDHIVRNMGSNSVAFLQHIMGLDDGDIKSYTLPEVAESSFKPTAQDIFNAVKEHGVGLVSSFKVDEAFHCSICKEVSKRDPKGLPKK
eukprot:TRINITY_DN8900_c0_g1_i2.p1 TRINITY_DN8900_c0_g1~~TRINITY_DN8900_c0_g1_i2.p1  ORF type:complete len:255 (+),score=40.04 TRINITY_DN8900_c0_g1_i2:67-831(+)